MDLLSVHRLVHVDLLSTQGSARMSAATCWGVRRLAPGCRAPKPPHERSKFTNSRMPGASYICETRYCDDCSRWARGRLGAAGPMAPPAVVLEQRAQKVTRSSSHPHAAQPFPQGTRTVPAPVLTSEGWS